MRNIETKLPETFLSILQIFRKERNGISTPAGRIIRLQYQYLTIHNKQQTELYIIQLRFLGYRMTIREGWSEISDKMGELRYLLIDKNLKKVIGALDKQEAKNWNFPKEYPNFRSITIEELTK